MLVRESEQPARVHEEVMDFLALGYGQDVVVDFHSFAPSHFGRNVVALVPIHAVVSPPCAVIQSWTFCG